VLGHPLVSFFSVIAENDDTSLRDFLPLSQNIASITKLFNSNEQKLWVSSGGSSLKSTGHGSPLWPLAVPQVEPMGHIQ